MIELPAWAQTALPLLSIALAALVAVWMLITVLRRLHGRAYNLTKIESTGGRGIEPSFTRIDHAARAAAIARGEAYDHTKPPATDASAQHAAVAGKQRLLGNFGVFARIGAGIIAVSHVGLGAITALSMAEDAQGRLESIDCLREVASRFKFGFVLAAIVLIAECSRFVRRRFHFNKHERPLT